MKTKIVTMQKINKKYTYKYKSAFKIKSLSITVCLLYYRTKNHFFVLQLWLRFLPVIFSFSNDGRYYHQATPVQPVKMQTLYIINSATFVLSLSHNRPCVCVLRDLSVVDPVAHRRVKHRA